MASRKQEEGKENEEIPSQVEKVEQVPQGAQDSPGDHSD